MVEGIKQAQKDAVLFAHYGKPIAEKAAIANAEQLQAEFDAHPLVIHYREVLLEANELLYYVTNFIQSELNDYLEEEKNASKNKKYTNDGTVFIN